MSKLFFEDVSDGEDQVIWTRSVSSCHPAHGHGDHHDDDEDEDNPAHGHGDHHDDDDDHDQGDDDHLGVR